MDMHVYRKQVYHSAEDLSSIIWSADGKFDGKFAEKVKSV